MSRFVIWSLGLSILACDPSDKPSGDDSGGTSAGDADTDSTAKPSTIYGYTIESQSVTILKWSYLYLYSKLGLKFADSGVSAEVLFFIKFL